MYLTEKQAHCVARILQSVIFGKSILDGCAFCKFECKTITDPAPHLDEIRKIFFDETGVDLRIGGSSKDKLKFSDFPYKRFLRASNDEIKNYFGDFFKSSR